MSDLPLRVGLLLDVSDSMRRVMAQEKSAALAFLQPRGAARYRPCFRDGLWRTVQIWQDPTSKVGDLIGAVKQAKGPGDSTEFFDAVIPAV